MFRFPFIMFINCQSGGRIGSKLADMFAEVVGGDQASPLPSTPDLNPSRQHLSGHTLAAVVHCFAGSRMCQAMTTPSSIVAAGF